MSKPFDATVKNLLRADPRAWMDLAHLAADGPLSLIDTDLSTVSAEADGVIRVDGPSPWLAHFEFQSGRDGTLGARLLRYNVLLGHHHDLPVQSVVLLLRPEADASGLTGRYERRLPDGRVYHAFDYLVLRIWERPVEEFLENAPAILPLALLANVSPAELPGVVGRIRGRLARDVGGGRANDLWTSALVLSGLKYPGELVSALFKGVPAMRESVTYMAILKEGATELLLRQGRIKFGPPPPHVQAAIESIPDYERLNDLGERLLKAESWDELLAAH